MNAALVDGIVKAVLYEGYMLYPYRPSSVKNRQRFNFGVVYPRTYAHAQCGADVWFTQTECLARSSSQEARISVKLRFLQMVERTVARATSYPGLSGSSLPRFEPVAEVILGGRKIRGWQEATECELSIPHASIQELCSEALDRSIRLEPEENREWLRDECQQVVGAILRKKSDIAAEL